MIVPAAESRSAAGLLRAPFTGRVAPTCPPLGRTGSRPGGDGAALADGPEVTATVGSPGHRLLLTRGQREPLPGGGALCPDQHALAVISGAATEEQRARWLPRFRDDPRCLLALAVTEPEVGSDHVIPCSAPDPPRLATRATLVAGGWCLEGTSCSWTTATGPASTCVMAQTDPSTGLDRGTTCFVIETGTPGLRPGRVFDKAGERLANHSEVLLEGCQVPEGAVLGAANPGFEVLERHFRGRATLADCCALGVAEAAYARPWPGAGSGSRTVDR
ncbi:MAG TPA: acyl-CoA dehydrogenase family protein [Candidatus Dormibacteraeota bacterium]|nr:acyl-CoA dehydrogenase family protein [Candidatus Dormibacteraeota bacterium]